MTNTTLDATGVTTSLTAKDLPTTLAFYRDILGCEVLAQMERDGKLATAIVRAGSVRFVLNQDDGGRGWDRVKGEGFSFQIETAQRVDDVAAGITARGGKLESEPADMPWGVRMFRLVDPDGYRLSIAQPLS